jgi:hypothetical protein
MTTLHQSDLYPSLDRNASRRACRIALSAALLAAVVACRAPPPRAAPPDRATPPPSAREPADGSYDWHGLLIAPFGSVLKDIPVALHEVLLFRDDAHDNVATGNAAMGNVATGNAAAGNAAGNATADAAAVDAECFAADAPAPRFVGGIPDEYLLCFKQGRLSRIQASVRVGAARASDMFAAACAGWLKNAASTADAGAPGAGASGAGASSVGVSGVGAPSAGASGAGAPSTGASGTVSPPPADAQSADVCEGHDGAVHFRGRLEEETGRAEMPQTESVLSVTLDSAPNP